jgi:hypothetical protein
LNANMTIKTSEGIELGMIEVDTVAEAEEVNSEVENLVENSEVNTNVEVVETTTDMSVEIKVTKLKVRPTKMLHTIFLEEAAEVAEAMATSEDLVEAIEVVEVDTTTKKALL